MTLNEIKELHATHNLHAHFMGIEYENRNYKAENGTDELMPVTTTTALTDVAYSNSAVYDRCSYHIGHNPDETHIIDKIVTHNEKTNKDKMILHCLTNTTKVAYFVNGNQVDKEVFNSAVKQVKHRAGYVPPVKEIHPTEMRTVEISNIHWIHAKEKR